MRQPTIKELKAIRRIGQKSYRRENPRLNQVVVEMDTAADNGIPVGLDTDEGPQAQRPRTADDPAITDKTPDTGTVQVAQPQPETAQDEQTETASARQRPLRKRKIVNYDERRNTYFTPY